MKVNEIKWFFSVLILTDDVEWPERDEFFGIIVYHNYVDVIINFLSESTGILKRLITIDRLINLY